jgi:predicted Rdx family selenoprotein
MAPFVLLFVWSGLAFAPQLPAIGHSIRNSGCSSLDAQPLAAMPPVSHRSDYLSVPPRVRPVVCSEVRTPSVAIEYCTRCNWMLRSAWLSQVRTVPALGAQLTPGKRVNVEAQLSLTVQELLNTFNGTVAEVRCSCASSHEWRMARQVLSDFAHLALTCLEFLHRVGLGWRAEGLGEQSQPRAVPASHARNHASRLIPQMAQVRPLPNHAGGVLEVTVNTGNSITHKEPARHTHDKGTNVHTGGKKREIKSRRGLYQS